MHILLLVLKIIGIALLVVLGIVLLLVLLLVFVPFCYRAEGSFYEDKPYAMVRIRYLFPLLHVFVKYQEENLEGKVKLFGFTIYDFFPSDEVKEKKEQKKEKKEQKKAKKEQEKSKKAKKAEKTRKTKIETSLQTEAEAEIKPRVQAEEKMKTSAKPQTKPEAEKQTDTEPEEEKVTLWEKIQIFVRTLKEKILSLIQKLKGIRDKGIEIKEKASYYYEIWQREETQRAFQTAKKTLYKIWKSIRPRKGLVKFHFGTGDPGSTGQMCGYLGMLYPFIGKYVMIEPDFENKIYEGDFYFKGRITLFVFLRAAWTILFDKDIKVLRKILMNS